MRLSEVAGKVGLTFSGHDLEIAAVNTLALAGPAELAPLLNRKHLPELAQSQAGAVLCEEKFAPKGRACLIGTNLKLDWARVVALFARPQGCLTGVSPQAFVHPEAVLAPNVTVYPFAFVGARATLGEGTTLFPGVYVGEDCRLGQG
jgi:UDP-3-O-[3-hydroxymyristoyl] glucosamine N-acyltransferase